jgi:hypothetical protein
MEHVKIPAGEIHAPHNWRAANAAARAAIAVSAEDVGKYCWQQDDNSEWMLVSADPAQWVQRGDMLASRYDADGDGKVWAAVAADTAPWAGVTGKPADYPPSAHGHAIADVAGLQPALDAKEAAGAAAAAVSAHVALADPHTQYTTAAEAAAAAPVQSVAGKTGVVILEKSDVGLGSVDNTADVDKPVSTATQTALNTKQPLDADLTAIAALAGTTGLLKKTAEDTWTLDTATYGDVTLTGAQTLTNKTLTSPIFNDGYTEEVFAVTGTEPDLSPANGSIQTWTLTDNSTPTAGTWASGQSMTLMVDDGSAYTINWASMSITWKTIGGTAPTLLTTGYTVIELAKVGSTVYGWLAGGA